MGLYIQTVASCLVGSTHNASCMQVLTGKRDRRCHSVAVNNAINKHMTQLTKDSNFMSPTLLEQYQRHSLFWLSVRRASVITILKVC